MNAPKDQGVSAGGSLFLARVALALMQGKQIFAALSLCPKGGRKVQAPVSAHQPGFYTETRKKIRLVIKEFFLHLSLFRSRSHCGWGSLVAGKIVMIHKRREVVTKEGVEI